MPGMDGIEATKAIRDIGTDYAVNIPIIALTVNAITGSEEMFLSHGFQAFLSKPIDILRLDEVIRRWVRNKELEESMAAQGIFVDGQLLADLQSGIDRRKTNIKLTGLDVNNGIERFGGDAETYMQILHSYTVNTRPLLESIERVGNDKLADYAIIVHGIKGSSRGIFADMIGDSAEHLELAAKSGDFNYVNRHNPTFLNAAWKLIHDIEDMLSDINTESPKPVRDKPDDEALSRLLAACKAYNMDGAAAAMAELDGYQYTSDGGLVEWLQKNVKLTNFKQIVERLSGLTSENAD